MVIVPVSTEITLGHFFVLSSAKDICKEVISKKRVEIKTNTDRIKAPCQTQNIKEETSHLYLNPQGAQSAYKNQLRTSYGIWLRDEKSKGQRLFQETT